MDHQLMVPSARRRIAVMTGAAGYIGKVAAQALLDDGWIVRCLGRAPPLVGTVESRPWRLGEAPPPDMLAGAAALIHLAHDWTTSGGADDRNIAGSAALVRAAAAAGIPRAIFVSSQSAHAKAANRYGQIKRAVETDWLAQGGVAVRPGFVFGGAAEGLYGTLLRLARLPVVPQFARRPNLQPIAVADLATALVRLAELPAPQRPLYHVAQAEPVGFGVMLGRFAEDQGLRRPRVVTLPVKLVLAGLVPLFMLTRLSLLDPERVRGLAAAATADTVASLAELQITASYRWPMPRRLRPVIRECRALASYVLGRPPSTALLRRLLRDVYPTRDRRALGLGELTLRTPSLLRLRDPQGLPGLAERLTQIAMILEFTPEAGDRFVRRRPSRIAAFADLGIAVASEGLCLPLRRLLERFRLRRIRSNPKTRSSLDEMVSQSDSISSDTALGGRR